MAPGGSLHGHQLLLRGPSHRQAGHGKLQLLGLRASSARQRVLGLTAELAAAVEEVAAAQHLLPKAGEPLGARA